MKDLLWKVTYFAGGDARTGVQGHTDSITKVQQSKLTNLNINTQVQKAITPTLQEEKNKPPKPLSWGNIAY